MDTAVEVLPPTISVERAGELLGVSRRSAYRAASRGQIPTVRIGRRLLVPTQRLLDMLGMASADTPDSRVSPRSRVAELPSQSLVLDDSTPVEPVTRPHQ